MKRIKKSGTVMLSLAIMLGCLVSLKTKVQAAPAAGPNSYVLEEGKPQTIQLDGKGAKERIRYEWSESTYFYSLDLYINDEKVAGFENTERDVAVGDVRILDIDPSDKTKDIFVRTYGSGGWSPATNFYYCRYENGKFKIVQNLKKLLEKELKGLPAIKEIGSNYHEGCFLDSYSDSTFTIMICGNSKQIGYFHALYPLELKNGKLKANGKTPLMGIAESCALKYAKSQDENGIFQIKYLAKLKKGCTFYTEPGGKKVAFKAKKGTKFKKSLYGALVKGRLYIGVQKENGKIGWIKDSQAPVFYTYPGVHIF